MESLQKQAAITFCYISVQLVPLEKLEHVHPLVKSMFSEELKQNVSLRGRISHFVQSWEKLTKDQENWEIENRYTPQRKSEIYCEKRDQRNVAEESNKSLTTEKSAFSKSISE